MLSFSAQKIRNSEMPCGCDRVLPTMFCSWLEDTEGNMWPQSSSSWFSVTGRTTVVTIAFRNGEQRGGDQKSWVGIGWYADKFWDGGSLNTFQTGHVYLAGELPRRTLKPCSRMKCEHLWLKNIYRDIQQGVTQTEISVLSWKIKQSCKIGELIGITWTP